jgi:hypothetical protein
MYTPSEAWGTWLGAIAQLATAIAVYRFSAKSAKASAQKSLNDMFNSWNQMSASSKEFREALVDRRGHVKDAHSDALIFSYLNILQSYFEMKKHSLVSNEEERAHFRNGIEFLSKLSDKEFADYLSRGYSDDFYERMMEEWRHRPKG